MRPRLSSGDSLSRLPGPSRLEDWPAGKARYVLSSTLHGFPEDVLFRLGRTRPGLARLFQSATEPTVLSDADAARVKSWSIDPKGETLELGASILDKAQAVALDRFLEGWLSTQSRLDAARWRSNRVTALLGRAAQSVEFDRLAFDVAVFETFAHLVGAFDSFGFAIWAIGRILLPGQFRDDEKNLRAITFKTASDRWIVAFPASVSTTRFRAARHDPRLEGILRMRNLTTHRAVPGLILNPTQYEVLGEYLWGTESISGSNTRLERESTRELARWAFCEIDALAAEAASEVERRLPRILDRAAAPQS
jgi:hypothetical protein